MSPSRLSRVSVVIPTHNRPHLLQRAVESVVGQNGVQVEVLVSDDGSNSAAAAENAALIARHSGARLIRSETATGVARARNRGAREATSDWLAFLDDDDIWSPDKLLHQTEAAEQEKRAWAISGAVWIDQDLDVCGASRPVDALQIVEELPLRNVVPAGSSSVMIQRSAFEKLGGFDPALHHMADWDYWIRCLDYGPPAVVDLPDVGYLRHSGNMSLDPENVFGELFHIEAKNRHRLPEGKADRAFVYRWVAWHRLVRGDRRGAARLYRDCVAEGDRMSILRMVFAHLGITRRRTDRSSLAWGSKAEPWLRAIQQREKGS